MIPYYQDEFVTIYNGDCELILPKLMGIDSIVTDPPYGKNEECNRNEKGRGNATASLDFAQVIGDDRPFNPNHLLKYKNVILWGANYYADKLPLMPSWLIWDKRDGIQSDDNADCEMAWTNLGSPARLFNHYWRGMIKASEKDERRQHPTQKPIALMAWCIRQIKSPGLICDPYCGSGPTLVAAKQLGLKAIGIEIVEHYCEVSARRVEGTTVMLEQLRRPESQQARLDV